MSSPGLHMLSSAGTIAVSPNGRGLNYVGKAVFNRSQAGGWYDDQVYRVSSPTIPVLVLRLYPGYAVRMQLAPVEISTGLWEFAAAKIDVDRIGPSPDSSAQLDVYCFARPASPQAAPQFYITDTDGVTLAYDLARPGLLAASHILSFPYQGWGETISSPPTVMGVLGDATFFEDNLYTNEEQDGSFSYSNSLEVGSWFLNSAGNYLVKRRSLWQQSSAGNPSLVTSIDHPDVVPIISLTGL